MRTATAVLSVFASLLVVIGANGQAPASSTSFVLSIDREGAFFATVDGTLLQLDEAAVRERAAAILRSAPDASFAIEAVAAAPFRSVTLAAQLLQQAGVAKIGFLTAASR